MIYTTVSDASFNIKANIFGWAFQCGPKDQRLIRAHGRFKLQPQSPAEAELMAVGHAVNCLQSNHELKAGDHIIIYTDCLTVRHYLKHHSWPIRVRNERLRKLTAVVYGTIVQTRGVTHEIRLISDKNNGFIRWCHSNSMRDENV